jgi:hypothetical protein
MYCEISTSLSGCWRDFSTGVIQVRVAVNIFRNTAFLIQPADSLWARSFHGSQPKRRYGIVSTRVPFLGSSHTPNIPSNDALRKHGILPSREISPKAPSPPPSPTLHEALADLSPDELRELGEDVTDEDLQRTVDAFRRQRLAEERKAVKRARFGRVYPIGREDYTREVTEASKISEEDDEDERGTGVICFLYKDG